MGPDAQNWDPGAVDPPLPVPIVLRSTITNDAGTLRVSWPNEPGLGHYFFYPTSLSGIGPISGQNVTGYSSISLSGFQDVNPWDYCWTVRQGKD